MILLKIINLILTNSGLSPELKIEFLKEADATLGYDLSQELREGVIPLIKKTSELFLKKFLAICLKDPKEGFRLYMEILKNEKNTIEFKKFITHFFSYDNYSPKTKIDLSLSLTMQSKFGNKIKCIMDEYKDSEATKETIEKAIEKLTIETPESNKPPHLR